MTCPGDGSVGTKGVMWKFENWSRARSHIVPIRLQPDATTMPSSARVAQLVAAVQAAEAVNGVVKAVGSGWSYPDVAIAPEVTFAIGTDGLGAVLSNTDPPSIATLIPFALNDAARADSRHYVHVEAGIKIHNLNCALDGMGLAMDTLGGTNGQALAGAINTGTHGSDVDKRPLADTVRAIHLVGPGGQEWWIERAGNRAITDPARMAQAKFAGLLCNSIRVEYDDLLFNAVLVAVGRMGIVYSYVVKVVDAYLLEIEREKKTWTEAAAVVRTDVRDGLAAGTRFFDIALNPYKNAAGEHDCVIGRKQPPGDPNAPLSGSTGPGTFDIFCNMTELNALLDEIALLLPPLVATAAAAATAGLSWMLLIPPPFGEGLFAAAATAAVTAATGALVALEAAVLAARTAPGDDLGGKLTSILNELVKLGQKQLVPKLTEQLVLLGANPNAPPSVQKSFTALTGQVPCDMTWVPPAECLHHVDGLEFTLDLSPGSEKLFAFIDDVFALTDEFFQADMPALFGLSLRFVKGTEALIGMQQFSRSCSVEFLMLRGMNGESDFITRLCGIAMMHDATPHWGLMHEIDSAEVARLYGTRLRDWRLELGRLIEQGGGKSGTFDTSYASERGLEPLVGGLVISNNLRTAIPLWDPTPQVEGTTTSTGVYLTNRANHATQVTDMRITTPDDAPGAPVFRVDTPRPFAVPAGGVLLVNVTFMPTHAGPITGRVEVECDDPVTPTLGVPLTTSARSLGRHAELQFVPTEFDFGSHAAGETVGQNLTITNVGFYGAAFDSIEIGAETPAGQFAVPYALPGGLGGGQSDTVYVSYSPTARGAAQATLVIDMHSRSDAGTVDFRHRYEIPLAGLAHAPTIFLAGRQLRPAPNIDRGPRPVELARPQIDRPGQALRDVELQLLDFGAVAPGTEKPGTFWIRNVGDAPLHVQGVSIVNQGSFGVTNVTIFPATLAPGGELEVPCNFLAPPVAGMPVGGEFRVLSDDPVRPSVALLVRGNAAGPHLADPSELLDLGIVQSSPASATLTFRSDGTDPVTLRKVELLNGADFTVSGAPQLPAQLAPGTELTLTVTLTSSQSGFHQDQLFLKHDGKPSGGSQVLVRGRLA